MNAWIIKHFPVTEEAIIVDRWFGDAFDTTASKDSANGRVHAIAMEGKEKQMLDMARELEKEEQEKKK